MTKIKNTSSAVMQQRNAPKEGNLDDFPTPPWSTMALCEFLFEENNLATVVDTVWEPAANRGYMVRPLEEYFTNVIASDIHDYGAGYPVQDFLNTTRTDVDWIITNPPFVKAKEFIEHALTIADSGVAVIVRSAFLESVGRYEGLFKDNPPTYVLQFVERVPMVEGRYDPKVSSATAYCWLVWDNYATAAFKQRGEQPQTILKWIAPCRKRLEKVEDYTCY